MFELSELIVKDGDNISDLIDERARSFYLKFNKHPTIAYVSHKILNQMLIQVNTTHLVSPSTARGMGHNSMMHQTNESTIEFKITKKYKDFLLVGDNESLKLLELYCDYPELWTDQKRREMETLIQKILLEDEC